MTYFVLFLLGIRRRRPCGTFSRTCGFRSSEACRRWLRKRPLFRTWRGGCSGRRGMIWGKRTIQNLFGNLSSFEPTFWCLPGTPGTAPGGTARCTCARSSSSSCHRPRRRSAACLFGSTPGHGRARRSSGTPGGTAALCGCNRPGSGCRRRSLHNRRIKLII